MSIENLLLVIESAAYEGVRVCTPWSRDIVSKAVASHRTPNASRPRSFGFEQNNKFSMFNIIN